MILKKLPLGLTDFKRVVTEGYYYIDKTLLIKELVDSGSDVILMPRPRRFGKSLNMSTLRYFFEKTEIDHSELFKSLNIWKQGIEYTKKQGKHPVIFFTFKDFKDSSWEIMYGKFKKLISAEYLKNDYLLKSGVLKDIEEKTFKRIMNEEAEQNELELSLKYLCEYLYRFHNERIFILIDEYDMPIQCGYVNGYYDEVITLMRNFLGAGLKDNPCLEKGVLTGILRVAKESIFSGLNNLNVSTLLDKRFSEYFGLTEYEVEKLLKYYKKDCKIEEVKSWYNGYTFGGTTIYNPWSILNFADSADDYLKPHWINTSSNDLVRNLITTGSAELKKELEDLINGKDLHKQIDENIVYGDIGNNTNSIWSFLLFTGYLKVESSRFSEGVRYCNLKIPNNEVRYLYKEIIKDWFSSSIHSDNTELMLKSLVSGDIKLFGKIFKEFISKTFSYFDISSKEPERTYHAFVLGLLVTLGSDYEVKSNRESGYDRYDVMIIPHDLAKKGVIIEFKKVDKDENEDLEKAAENALKQIEEKDYGQELRCRGIKDIVSVGIAFEGKNVLVKG